MNAQRKTSTSFRDYVAELERDPDVKAELETFREHYSPTGPGTLAYAQETHRLALTNFDNVLPWHWLRWWRVHREVRRRMAVHARAMGWKS